MGYKPRLGGIKRMQALLAENSIFLPVFQTDLYKDPETGEPIDHPGPGKTVSLEEMIRKYGPLHRVVDVCLTQGDGERYLAFLDMSHCRQQNLWESVRWLVKGMILFGYNPSDDELKRFVSDPKHNPLLYNITEYGLKELSFYDCLEYIFLRKMYIERVFGELL